MKFFIAIVAVKFQKLNYIIKHPENKRLRMVHEKRNTLSPIKFEWFNKSYDKAIDIPAMPDMWNRYTRILCYDWNTIMKLKIPDIPKNILSGKLPWLID